MHNSSGPSCLTSAFCSCQHMMRCSSASFSGIKRGHKQTSNHLLAICGFADHQLQISLKKTQLPFGSACRIYWAWLMCINHAHIFVDRNLKRTSPYLETHILVGVRLEGVYSFLRSASSVSVTQSKGESQSSKPPHQTFSISGWQRWCCPGPPL